jgi:hypothetical protein
MDGRIKVKMVIKISRMIVPSNPIVVMVINGKTAKKNNISTCSNVKYALRMVALIPNNQKICENK